jgi:hypothetical protein
MNDATKSLALEEFQFLIGEALNGTDEARDNALKLIGNILDFEKDTLPVTVEWPEDLSRYTYNQIEEGIGQFARYLDHLVESYIKLENISNSVQNEITYESTVLKERLEKLRSKIAAYSLYGNENINSVIFNFQNREEFNNEANPSLSFNSRGVTLPISEAVKLKVKNIGLASGSNGVSGNPYSYGSPLSFLSSTIDESPYTAYVYSSVNSTTQLVLDIELASNAIVNCLSVEFTSGYLSSLNLSKLEAIDNSGKSFELLSSIALTGLSQTLYFAPVETSKLRLFLNGSGLREGVPAPGSLTGVQHSLITLRDISFFSVKFQSQGDLVSKTRNNVGTVVDFKKIKIGRDEEFNLFDYEVFVRKDKGWEPIGTIESFIEFADVKDLQFKLKLQSNRFKFEKNYKEILFGARKNYITESFLPLSLNSTSTYNTSSKFKDLTLLKTLKYRANNQWMTLDRAQVALTEVTGSLFYIDNQNIEEEILSRISLFVNGVQKSNSLLKLVDFFGQKYLLLGEFISANSEVQISIEPELAEVNVLDARSWDGKTFNTSASIVPNSMKVYELDFISNSPIVELISPGATKHQCKYGNIFDVSVVSDTPGLLTQVPYNPIGSLGSNEYRVNRTTGLIEFGRRLNGYRCIYKYANYNFIASDADYASGQIKINNYRSHLIKETLGSSIQRKTIEPSGVYYHRDVASTLVSRVGYLSERGVVPGSLYIVNRSDLYKQVPYINGVTEFTSGSYGQTTLNESIIEDAGIVSWQVKEGALVNFLGVYPLDTRLFLSKKLSIDLLTDNGDWCFDGEKLFLKTDIRSISAIDVGYFYNNFGLSQYLYSVNYKHGKVFFSESIGELESIEVAYSIAHYKVSYQGANVISKENYLVKDNTDSNSIKLLTRDEKNEPIFVVGNKTEESNRSMVEYYSPVLEFIEFGAV